MTDPQAAAESLVRWMFPDNDTADDARSELDRTGRGWGMGRAEVQRRLAHLPERTLAAAVEFAHRDAHPEVQRGVTAFLAAWCAGEDEERKAPYGAAADQARDLSMTLALAGILSAAAAADETFTWTEVHMFIGSVGLDYRIDTHRILGRRGVPREGILYAEPEEISDFRTLSLGMLLTARFTPGERLTASTFAYLADHLDRHEEIVGIVAERRTVDPAALDLILGSGTPALSEGVL